MIFYTWMDDWIEVHIIFHFNKKVLEADDDGDVGRGYWINWLQDILEVCQLLLNILAVLSYCMLNWQPQPKCNPTKICFLCPITSPHHCCFQLHPCSVFFSHVFVLSCASSCVICVPLAVHQWLRNTTANPNIDVRLWKAWTLRLWSLKRWSPVWKTPGQPVPRVHCRYELGDKILSDIHHLNRVIYCYSLKLDQNYASASFSICTRFTPGVWFKKEVYAPLNCKIAWKE